ncbi:ciliogenesis and planar polarity effector 2 [Boleophthalmus pectinirostris]|uniref:ciliogenesis and planar polarity effector 2 n=1 Tax=Boleophthalmus pectinirostris TaxID=150288 RepID=UPI00242C06DA|nr:ciliogenesis and planar polarity effector 2 [Boleophthalmus pectinirostris]
MAQVPSPGSIIVADWHQCKDSKEYFNKILHKKRRRQFGLLESPMMSPLAAVDTVQYKIFLSGKSGVGKTSAVARLAGVNIPNIHYETIGIETTIVYWPVKIKESGRVLFFRLQLWDCGENALKRFDHMLPFCKEQIDAVLLLFSFTDRISFEDLPNQISKWMGPSPDRVVKLVVGTKFDLFMHCDVAERDVRAFRSTWGLPVLHVGGEVSDGLGDVAQLLNCLCENLWYQDCLRAGAERDQPHTQTFL